MDKFLPITINQHCFTPADIKQRLFIAKTNFEQNTLQFCYKWISGENEFQIQTSGSTGNPKVISFQRNQLEASAKLTEQALNLKKGYNALVCLDTKYIAGQMMLVRSFVAGMNIFAVEPSANPFEFISSKTKIDFAALVPYQVQAILTSAHSWRFNEIKKIIIGGAAISESIIQQLQNYSCEFYATYGMTETVSHVALQRLNGYRENSFSPLPGISLSKDDRGCLVIDAPHLRQTIITNDLVSLNDDQSFTILGRWDNVINSGGIKIIPEKVENKINAFAKVEKSFFVGALPDEKLGQRLVLVIEDAEWTKERQEKLLDFFKIHLDKYEIPKEIFFLLKFIQTETGKINRKETLNLLPAR